MIIEIPDENSIVKWKNDEKDEWKVAEISDLIKAYERPKGDLISREDLKKHVAETIEIEEKIDKKWAMGLKYSLKLIDNALTIDPTCQNFRQVEPERPQSER